MLPRVLFSLELRHDTLLTLSTPAGVAVGSEDATTSMTYAERMREKAARRFEGAS